MNLLGQIVGTEMPPSVKKGVENDTPRLGDAETFDLQGVEGGLDEGLGHGGELSLFLRLETGD